MHAAYDALLADIVSTCRRHYGARLLSLAVYGSVGRGTPRPDLDVDLLLVATDLPNGLIARNDEFDPVRTALGPRLAAAGAAGLHPLLAPIFKTRAELERGTPLLLDMTEDARILHDPTGCLANALERLRRRLRALGSRRIWRGAYWYWDLKPDYRPGEIFELFGP
jgi:predicted nucleotidyltransferase